MGGFHHMWLMARALGFGDALGDYCLEHQAAEAGKFVHSDAAPMNYAYHFDAGLYARFLRSKYEPKGVNAVEGKIASVEQTRPPDMSRRLRWKADCEWRAIFSSIARDFAGC
jgi:tryptophan halogenase